MFYLLLSLFSTPNNALDWDILLSLFTIVSGIFMAVVVMVYSFSQVGKSGSLLNWIALDSDQEGFISVPDQPKITIGKTGIAATMLRPSGRVLIDAQYYDAVAYQGYIEKGRKIKVVKYENAQLYVTEIKEQAI